MRRIKILYILEACKGGTRKHVMDLLHEINQYEFELSFCYSTLRSDKCFTDGLESLKQKGIECHEVSMTREINIKSDIKSFIKLYSLIKEKNYDIVHCHSSKAGFLGRFAAKLERKSIKTIYSPHSMSYNIHPYYSMLEKFASLVTDKIIAASESEKKEIISKGIIRASKIITISSGIDINLKSTMGKNYIREIIKIPSACKIILSVGRLSPQKDPITFFRAANIIKNIYPQWYFVWIGDGELKEDIDNYIQCNNLEGRCFILGWRTDYNDLIASADIFVLTSTYESFGYVTCNALLNEIPTIGTNVTGTKDIIEHEVSGYLVNAKDYKKIAELIIKLLNDDSLRAKFIKNGYQRIITHFDVREMVINTELFYKSLLA